MPFVDNDVLSFSAIFHGGPLIRYSESLSFSLTSLSGCSFPAPSPFNRLIDNVFSTDLPSLCFL